MRTAQEGEVEQQLATAITQLHSLPLFLSGEDEEPAQYPSTSRTVSATPSESPLAFSASPSVEEDLKPKLPPPSPVKKTNQRFVDKFGPRATFPFLPDTIDGDAYYSCRPGGPRIYDILNTLSLESFGVLAWAITDREEELFELDDVLDEDKVMMALWYRWIFLNR